MLLSMLSQRHVCRSFLTGISAFFGTLLLWMSTERDSYLNMACHQMTKWRKRQSFPSPRESKKYGLLVRIRMCTFFISMYNVVFHSLHSGSSSAFRGRRLELADISLLWMQNEALTAGLRFQKFDAEWKFDEIDGCGIYDQLLLNPVSWIYELLPLRKQNYTGPENLNWYGMENSFVWSLAHNLQGSKPWPRSRNSSRPEDTCFCSFQTRLQATGNFC